MNLYRKVFTITIILCALAGNATAYATLVNGDWGGSTLDTNSGLTWVDISQTKSYSINMALNSVWMTDRGFKYASLSQVDQLFSNVGIISGDTSASGAGALELANNLGFSYFYFSGNDTVHVGRGIYGYDTATNTAGWAEFSVRCNIYCSSTSGWTSSNAETDWSAALDQQFSSLFSGYVGGHWLVYDQNINNVPEPGVVLLMMFGLIGMSLWRRRK